MSAVSIEARPGLCPSAQRIKPTLSSSKNSTRGRSLTGQAPYPWTTLGKALDLDVPRSPPAPLPKAPPSLPSAGRCLPSFALVCATAEVGVRDPDPKRTLQTTPQTAGVDQGPTRRGGTHNREPNNPVGRPHPTANWSGLAKTERGHRAFWRGFDPKDRKDISGGHG